MVWIRSFSLVFGSTVVAMSLVIAVFFTGLALGSQIFGKVSISIRNPVRLYAILEILISLYALIFPQILSSAENIYASLHPFLSANSLLLILARVLIACLVLLLPTMMMGGTLPILARYFIKKSVLAGRQAGLLYGLNALGASLGCFLTGYLFFHTLGLSKTNILAGTINLMLALTALVISQQTKLITKTPEETETCEKLAKIKNIDSKKIFLTVFCFGISGFVSMAYEIVWLRYLLFFFRDTSFLYAGIIGVFILGIAAGSLLCGWIVKKVKPVLAFFGFLQMGIGLSTILAIYLPLPWHNIIFEAGEKSCVNILGILFSLLIIPTILMGATFPVVVKIIT